MVRIASEAEEELRRPGRERERLVRERLQLESRVESLLCLHGIVGFKPRLKKAFERLEALQTFAGSPLPPKTMAELRRLMVRHRLVSDPTARDRGRARRGREDRRAGPRRANDPAADPDRRPRCRDRDRSGPRDARLPFGTDLGGRDAVTDYGCKMPPFRVVPPSQFRDRRALASFVGLTGTPFQSGGMEREQGIGKNGNARVRHILMQLAWRWLRFQPQSPLSRWFVQRTSGAKGRIRKVMIVALARKLLVALWRYVETGELRRRRQAPCSARCLCVSPRALILRSGGGGAGVGWCGCSVAIWARAAVWAQETGARSSLASPVTSLGGSPVLRPMACKLVSGGTCGSVPRCLNREADGEPGSANRRSKMPRHRTGSAPMTPAERQARCRARRRQQSQQSQTASPAPRLAPRPRRWAAAVATLIELQDNYRAWLDNLPANLEASRLAEKLQAIAELDIEELQAIDPPRGYGRD